ncbi:hypothetical protein Tco_0812726 [Tanacetum coccineum]
MERDAPSYTHSWDPILRLPTGLLTGNIAGGVQICEELDDTWAWIAPRPERQQVLSLVPLRELRCSPYDVRVSSRQVLTAQTGTILHHLPAGPSQTRAQRLGRLEEDFRGLRGALASRERVKYTSYADFQIPYPRRVRRRTDDASTSAP